MKGHYIFDIEANGLNPDKIWCLSVHTGREVKSTTSYKNMRKFFGNAKILVGHNIYRFDIPVLEDLAKIVLRDDVLIVDTLSLSWYLFPERVKHGLADWGEFFGIPKPKIDNWENLELEEYINRCEEDVKINKRLYDYCWERIRQLYPKEEDAWNCIKYLSFKMYCAKLQERCKWKVDLPHTNKALSSLTAEFDHLTGLLSAAMPKVEKTAKKTRPAKPFKKDGTWSVNGAKWFNLLKRNNLPEDYRGEVEVVMSEEEPNPNSHDQIKSWLYSLGWVPTTIKHNRNKETNEVTEIPQVRKEVDGVKVLCPSVLRLAKDNPAINHLEKITVLQHRISILKGFLSNSDDEGYIKAEIQGLTNTLRFKHKVVVNLPGVDKAYGKEIRSCLVAPEGYELCGSDMASLEDRTKQHYMWKHDPDYVTEMNVPGFDPHLDLAVMAKMLSQKQVEEYKAGDHTNKPIRHKAKTVNYSCTYGITPKGLVRDTGMSLKEATILHTAYWDRNWSIQAIADECEVKTIEGQKWLFNPVSKIWYSLRHDKDKFSTLNQGTGTYCFDMWVKEILAVRDQLTGQFHDEVVLCVKKGFRKQAESLLRKCIATVNDKLKLNRQLDIDVQFGGRYSDIH